MTTRSHASLFATILSEHGPQILSAWSDRLKSTGALASGRLREAELQTQCRTVLELLSTAIAGGLDAASPNYGPLRDVLADVSRSRAVQGFTPSETATFVFSLKQPLFEAVSAAEAGDPSTVARAVQDITQLIDALGLYTIEVFQKSREETIIRQQREIAELSTPVVKLWDGILALPLIGTLDSQRTQVVMENLLESIVAQTAEIAIIDITGVPTVDTLTAQHLLKTVSAARLMGADCIISGIRPQIAQTMVHLGVELNVVSKATLADAFALALKRVGRTVVAVKARELPAG
ncbi:STAS domain-containing protein [Rhodoplanes sp. TEM]|uniref:STAS domain-containing protein n=1 Tax=Rhodoplanes tepidamans TaxID=200616 RepID=A0ABT5J655_RHOTP|nr:MULTISPECIES: STAS domain-containing protein [Rhodoplanes]MDC7785130.1 STAS domain-containing protein [Rhodoplanes tepidamans]MDC7982604.1 STAS domain-containing protein [Rhodoplanes sp. TEM]MDQ0356620.1 rsbT co-antagonist protein RsbR [Rhodoplanes tepidamans]